MLYIVTDANREGPWHIGGDKEWYVGQRVPIVNPDSIKKIQVDGDEKKYVEELGFLKINKPVATYYGDLARMIYLNLEQV